MSIEGRITVDALFHDKDGTASLKVLSLQDSEAYSSGTAAIWSGTCGTTSVTLNFGPTTYRNASGSLVNVQPGGSGRVCFIAPGNGATLSQASGSVFLMSYGQACTSNIDEQESISVAALTGTSRYTVIVYGES